MTNKNSKLPIYLSNETNPEKLSFSDIFRDFGILLGKATGLLYDCQQHQMSEKYKSKINDEIKQINKAYSEFFDFFKITNINKSNENLENQ